MQCLDRTQQKLIKKHSILPFPWEIRPMPALAAAQLCSARALFLALPRGAAVGTGKAWAGCPQCSMQLRHTLCPPCKLSPSVSTSDLPLRSPLASALVPGDPKPAACLPQLCSDDFQLLPREGILLTLSLEETTAFFFSPTALCSLQSCRFPGVPELGLSMQASSCRHWTLQELPWMPVELGRCVVLGKMGAWLWIQFSFVLSCSEEVWYRKRPGMRMSVHMQNGGCRSL